MEDKKMRWKIADVRVETPGPEAEGRRLDELIRAVARAIGIVDPSILRE